MKDEQSQGWWTHLLKDKDHFKNKCKIDFEKWTEEEDESSFLDKLDSSMCSHHLSAKIAAQGFGPSFPSDVCI